MAKKTHLRYMGGENKTLIRNNKITIIRSFRAVPPLLLTLPGEYGVLERTLIKTDVVKADRIVGVQKAGNFANYDGKEILKRLVRNTSSTPFPIYIKDFVTLPRFFGPQYSDDIYAAEKKVRLGDKRSFAKWIDRYDAPRFSVCDLDFCCPFYKPVAQAICSLFHRQMLADAGLMFITHVKGREMAPDISYLASANSSGNVDLTDFRFCWVPDFYVRQAERADYRMCLIGIYDYKDGHQAQTMLQYMFAFERKSFSVDCFRNTEKEWKKYRTSVLPHASAGAARRYIDTTFYKRYYD